MQNRKRDTDVQNRLLDSMGEGDGGMFWENSIETSILSRVKQTTSPAWIHETSAQGWCTGKTQRDGMEREVEGGSGWGAHVNPWLIHVNVWQKPLQYCKLISLQIIKINGKKKKHVFLQEGKHFFKHLLNLTVSVMSEIFPHDDFDSFSWQSIGKYIPVFVVKKVDCSQIQPIFEPWDCIVCSAWSLKYPIN